MRKLMARRIDLRLQSTPKLLSYLVLIIYDSEIIDEVVILVILEKAIIPPPDSTHSKLLMLSPQDVLPSSAQENRMK